VVGFMSTFLVAFAAVVIFFNCLFVAALKLRDNSIVDIGWGVGFILVTVVTLVHSGTMEARQLLVMTLVLVWGLRLAIRIYRRNRGRGEDFRYKKWREDWGEHWRRRAYLFVFVGQGLMMLLITVPIMLVNTYQGGSLGWLDLVGVGVWLLGFYFEATGDHQLDQFLKEPSNRGRVIESGLWHYTRHPNYFGEVTQWWGIYLIALSIPWGWLGAIGPVTITVLIVAYSGIPMLEKTMMKNPAYVEYARRTSVFFPLPPRRSP
jgi:steroid 5-alpha reductase family enzyme